MEAGPRFADLTCYVQVARELSFSAAAARLGMSQSAVSQTIARLERVLDVRLFERTSREVQLTYTGKVLLPLAEELLERAQAFSGEAARLSATAGMSIRLAYCPLTGGLAARAVRGLANRTPPIPVRLRPSGWSEATADLGPDAVAIMSKPFPPGFAHAARFHIPVGHVAVSSADPLARASRLTWAQLNRATILLARARPPGSLWAQAVAQLDAAGAGYREAEAPEDWTAALDLAAARAGVLPAPAPLVETVRRPDIAFLAIEPGLMLTYGIVWSAEHAGPATLALVQALQEHLRRPTR